MRYNAPKPRLTSIFLHNQKDAVFVRLKIRSMLVFYVSVFIIRLASKDTSWFCIERERA